jgi:hypothetical protein
MFLQDNHVIFSHTGAWSLIQQNTVVTGIVHGNNRLLDKVWVSAYGSTSFHYISHQVLSDTLLDDTTCSALAKGLNFTVSPSAMLNENITGSVEKATSKLITGAARGLTGNCKNPQNSQETKE